MLIFCWANSKIAMKGFFFLIKKNVFLAQSNTGLSTKHCSSVFLSPDLTRLAVLCSEHRGLCGSSPSAPTCVSEGEGPAEDGMERADCVGSWQSCLQLSGA